MSTTTTTYTAAEVAREIRKLGWKATATREADDLLDGEVRIEGTGARIQVGNGYLVLVKEMAGDFWEMACGTHPRDVVRGLKRVVEHADD